MREEGELARVMMRQAGISVREEAVELTKVAGRVLSRSAWLWRLAGSAVLGMVVGVAVCFGVVAAFPA